MAEIINLNKVRQRKAREEMKAKSGENRVSFGRPKRQREEDSLRESRKDADHDGKRLERQPPAWLDDGNDKEPA